MWTLINNEDRRVKIGLWAGAFALLAACLFYNVYFILTRPNPGITFDARWEITAINECNSGPESCPELLALQLHDRLLSVGGVFFADYVADPGLIPFGGFQPGDVVPLTVLRDDRVLDVEWRVQSVALATIARYGIISLLLYGSFWLAGTFVLLYMRPADLLWTLLTSLFYLISIWLAVGLVASSNVAYSTLILRIVGWLMVPILVHLHLVVPGSLVNRHRRFAVTALYGLALLLLGLQVAGLLPWFAYLAGILIAAVISIGLLAYRILTPRAPSERLTARLMLAGILFALAPGLVLSAIPLILDIGSGNAVGAALSILAMPMLPLFYTYAIYKHRLGLREHRINRLLVQYTLFLLYLILLTLVFVIMASWISTANELLAILALVGLAILIAILPLRRPVQVVFDRLTYGTRYSHREILADYAERIPAAVDRPDLVQLLKYELAPELEIRQSALFVRQGESVEPIYWQGVGLNDGPESWEETESLLGDADRFLVPEAKHTGGKNDRLAWARLVIPLQVQGRPTGAWLFGRRESDDIYSQDDIDLLDRLSGLVAITLESGALFEALSHELATRELTEARLAAQSKQLALLHEIDGAILAAGSPAEIARAAFAGIRQLVPCIRVSVLLLDPDRDNLTVLAAQGTGPSMIAENAIVPVTAVPAFETLLQGHLFVSDDVQQDMAGSKFAAALASSGVRAVVSAPLMASGDVFGALHVASDKPASYSARHVAIVEEVSTSVALAIHNARLRETLNKNSQQLQLLSARLIDAQETERKRLSHELHDEMGQILTAISLNLAAIERKLPPDGNDNLRAQLADANAFVAGLTNQVRSLSLELRPAMLLDLGLTSTLRWYVANYTRRRDMQIRFKTDVLPEHLAENVEITAYRVVQEALTNANRHSGASKVDLRISRGNGTIQIVIEDNGCGFDPDSVGAGEVIGSGVGLVMMRERISTINGRLDIRSRPGEGTRITAEIPFMES